MLTCIMKFSIKFTIEIEKDSWPKAEIPQTISTIERVTPRISVLAMFAKVSLMPTRILPIPS